MEINIWTIKFMLPSLTHCRSGCQSSMEHGARSMEESLKELAGRLEHGGNIQ